MAGLAIGAGFGEGVNKGVESFEAKIVQESFESGPGQVLDKEVQTSRTMPVWNGKMASQLRLPDQYFLKISLDDRTKNFGEQMVEVSKEQFNSLEKGDKIEISYEINQEDEKTEINNIKIMEK